MENKDLFEKRSNNKKNAILGNSEKYYFDIILEVKTLDRSVLTITQKELSFLGLNYLINNLENIIENADFEEAVERDIN